MRKPKKENTPKKKVEKEKHSHVLFFPKEKNCQARPLQGVVEICHRQSIRRDESFLRWHRAIAPEKIKKKTTEGQHSQQERRRDLCRLDRKSSYFYLTVFFLSFILFFCGVPFFSRWLLLLFVVLPVVVVFQAFFFPV